MNSRFCFLPIFPWGVGGGALCLALAVNPIALSQGRFLGDGGTIIGRVFIDKNFDGEKQANEPGIANAVILMDDGLRVTTDSYGRFTVPSVSPGYHTGVLDLSSIPGYRIAPNRYIFARNSSSRMVRVAAGSMARMNFGVISVGKKRKILRTKAPAQNRSDR